MDLALILFVLLIFTGAFWLADKLVFAKTRAAQRAAQGIDEPEPWWVEWIASFFPVILVVFVLRSFIVEPFRIPSGSMLPTLEVGDFILVNKYTYGIRLPVINKKIIEMGKPERGDVMVFKYPLDPSMDYIKRVVGLPGDVVEYHNKRLRINGEDIQLSPYQAEQADYLLKDRMYFAKRLSEKLGTAQHDILNDPDAPAYVRDPKVFPMQENCIYNGDGITCKVPAGHYFMMGDNRDGSSDSRYWGFVPEENIVGKAFFIWFHAQNLIPPSGIEPGRIGSFK